MMIDRHDFLDAVRSARRTPLLTFVVVLALSVGIGLNAGVFSMLDSMFLEPPTGKDPAGFVQIYPRYQGWYIGATKDSSFNAADYEAMRGGTRSIADLAAWQSIGATLDDVRRPGNSILVSCNYFRVFGIDRPLMGRFFNQDECNPGSAVRIAILSEHVWRDVYSADPHIIGKLIHISSQVLAVVGIVSDHSTNVDIWNSTDVRPCLPAFGHFCSGQRTSCHCFPSICQSILGRHEPCGQSCCHSR
jgi:hypothetical protein